MLFITKSIHITGKVVLGGYSLCVMKVLVDVGNEGIYGCNIIKKRWFWSCYIYGKKIKSNLIKNYVWSTDELHSEIDNVTIQVFSMEEEDYVMILMSDYEKNDQLSDDKSRTISELQITFKYYNTVYNHY